MLKPKKIRKKGYEPLRPGVWGLWERRGHIMKIYYFFPNLFSLSKRRATKGNNSAGAASQCYHNELMLLKCELMLLKCDLMLS